ncbi:MAG TPA: hypothetical protein EYN67_04950 [Flavobacteriales bacterium]|nr:hypothetical protein [Flavobacteriales bacterium]
MKIHGTAKGGALSTKDFGVAFGGAAAPSIPCYDNSTHLSVSSLSNTAYPWQYEAGMQVTSEEAGTVLNGVITYMSQGTDEDSTGTYDARVYTGTTLRATSATINASALGPKVSPQEPTEQIFMFASPYTLAEDDYVVIHAADGGAPTKYADISTTVDATPTHPFRYGVDGTTWTTESWAAVINLKFICG